MKTNLRPSSEPAVSLTEAPVSAKKMGSFLLSAKRVIASMDFDRHSALCSAVSLNDFQRGVLDDFAITSYQLKVLSIL